jgi:nitric oxide reductase NorD protein
VGIDRLRLLASAIAGRALEVADAGAGEPAWTDGATVFVDATARPPDRVAMAAVQAALVGAGSLDRDVVARLARRPALARRYLAVEGLRALAAARALVPVAVRALVAPAGGDAVAGGPAGSLATARGRGRIADPPAVFGTIRPRRVLTALDRLDALAPGDAAVRPLAEPPTPTPAPGELRSEDELDPEDGDDERDVGHLLSSPVGGRGALGRLLARLLSPTRAPGGGGPAGADAATQAGRARPRGRGDARARPFAAPGAAGAGAPAAFGPQVRTYPEWDTHRRRYRPDWCTVQERDPRPEDEGGDGTPPRPDSQALRRPLARLGTGLGRVRRRPQGDDLDVDAVVESRVDEASGLASDGAVYVETLRRRRDLAVLVLLDVSGSAGEPAATPVPGPTVHHHQRAAAAALTQALHDLGDRVALYAFNSQGRTAVHVTRVKAFDDRLDGRVARRLGGLVPGAYTRLGAAIRHGGAVLGERGGTSRRLLLVLSDGFAYDHGYEGPYGEADARRALAEVRRRGMGCLCLSVGAATDPVELRRVFGTAAHATVPGVDRLPGLVGPLFRTALRDAEGQRRTYQRKERTRGWLDPERRTP